MPISFTKKNPAGLIETAGSDDRKGITALILQVMALFWLLAKIISRKVWLKERTFPLVPPFEWMDWPSWIHAGLLILSIALLSLLIWKPLNRALLISLLITEIISCLGDQNRWQPWEYQYLFIVFILLLNSKNYKKTIIGIAFIMAATYFYSGLGKLNENYLVAIWERIFIRNHIRPNDVSLRHTILHYSGYLTAIMEIVFAAGLFFIRTQKIAAWALMLMHLVILGFLGPFGMKYNIIIWPWNLLMMALLYIIFIKNNFVQISVPALWPGWNKLVLVCWGILPAFSYAGLWDNYLSCSLYSGRLPEMVACIKDSAEINLLKSYASKRDTHNFCNAGTLVNIQTWAMSEMNVPPYPEMRVYKKIKKYWLKNYPGSNTAFIYYRTLNGREIKILPEE